MISFDNFKLFSCDPNKNAACRKTACYINSGPCSMTKEIRYKKELQDMSNLEAMLDKQRDFQMRLQPDFLDMGIKDRVAFIKEHSIHLNQEINEMLYELPFFKPWKDYSNMSPEAINIAMAKARMECIDAWHFFMNIMLALGFSADEFFDMYMDKNAENHRRQDEGYTADVSYKDQSVSDVVKNRCSVTSGDAHVSGTNFISMVRDAEDTLHLFMDADIIATGALARIADKRYRDVLKLLPEDEATFVVTEVNNIFTDWSKHDDKHEKALQHSKEVTVNE